MALGGGKELLGFGHGEFLAKNAAIIRLMVW
jgi:hypothetical protein